jgi:hypothetical protein
MTIIRELGYRNACTMLMSKILNVENKTARKKHVQNFSSAVRKTEGFLSRIVNGDGTWIHHYDPLTKRINGMASPVIARQEKIQVAYFLG